MEKNKRLWSVILIAFIATSFSFAQSEPEKKENAINQLKEVVDSKEYKINVNMAHPRRGRTVPLTSNYSLEIKNDSVISYLPYYGRAYSIPYGGGDGLRFAAPISDYSVSYNKKGRARISVTTRTSEDSFKFNIEIYPGGSANFDVNMQNRESIRFTGKLEENNN